MIFMLVNILLCYENGLVLAQTPLLSDVIHDILSKSVTKKRFRPLLDQNRPLSIFVNVNIYDITSIKEMEEEYSMVCVVKQTWKDDRLAYSSYNGSIPLNPNQVDRIWIPDLVVRNLKSGSLNQITVPNRQLLISPDGTVIFSQRLSLTLICKMVLDTFPMDNQTCHIEFESYGYPIEHINLYWVDENPVSLIDELKLGEFKITGITHSVCLLQFNQTGNFSCLRAYFKLKRRLSGYLKSTYLPSVVVVLLSWGPFWIDPDAVPARASLSLLSIITITTQSASLPKSAGPFTKALDIWMTLCVLFIFAAFLKVLGVNTLWRHIKKEEASDDESDSEKKRSFLTDPVKIRKISRIMFPLSFIIFNVVYWSYYLTR